MTMRVLAAPDKFRGTATAPEVAAAIAAAVVDIGGTARRLPLADGGEGTLDALGGPNRWTTVTGPLGAPLRAGWRITDAGDAVIEMAVASGLLAAGGADGNDPWSATTRGTGELIAAATDAGARRIVVGLGGSATTDGGFGALEVLRAHPRWGPHLRDRPELVACCDVNTPFVSAAEIFGPQKGADPAMVARLRRRLVDLAVRYRAEFGVDVTTLPGAGAAGGLAGGLAALGGRLQPGFELIARVAGLDEALAAADVVVTGEGQLDEGSFDGKVVGGVVAHALAHGVPVIAVVGHRTDASRSVVERDHPQLTVLSLVELCGRAAALTDTAASVRRVVAAQLQAMPSD